MKSRQQPPLRLTNLDYLSFGNEPETQAQPANRTMQPVKAEPGPTDWERLLGSLDNGQNNIYDACYGGGSGIEALFDNPSAPINGVNNQHANTASSATNDIAWNPDLWALYQTETNTSGTSGFTQSTGSHHPDSILSFSTDEANVSSGNEDFGPCDWVSVSSSGNGAISGEAVRAIMLPTDFEGESLNFDGGNWDNSLNM